MLTQPKPVTRASFDDTMVPVYQPAPVVPVRAQGCHVWDSEGREYIDLAGGIAVTALGHGHPEVIAVLSRQAAQLCHISNVYTNEPAVRLGDV